MALLSAEHLAGPGYIILNVVRALNIITLASVVASSVVMLVKTFIVSKFFFFDATSHVVTGLVGMFLMISECSIFKGYFARNWPLLSPSHGFVSLGCAMMVLGLNLLGNMNKEATSQDSLGMPFWRLLVASGILAIVIGFFNVIASYVFRDGKRGITSRNLRSDGAIALTKTPDDIEADPKLRAFTISTHHTGGSSYRSASFRNGSPPMRTQSPLVRPGTPPIDMGSPQPAASPEKHSHFSQFDFSPMRAFKSARESFLPSYHSTSPQKSNHHRRSSSMYSRSTSGESKRFNFWRRNRDSDIPDVPRVPEISGPLNVNPQFAHLIKPDAARHPSQRRPEVNFDKI
ncbi:hypothetical protein BS50DRAFT_94084 [Corynespora cassiicola Philippines]|uniref:DUF7598 domain-containing protein n=1 Tax=Corynespora cassiicola Philippines TaxID=1448308 RepID=A0A2T2NEV5_CORCC|nr:hypothetical protein BS50DRAFT_94084 [Corynespora cassiicola Philippines]